MTTYYKRYIRHRFYSWIDDCKWQWDRHREGFWCGFAFGVMLCTIVLEIVLGV